MTTITLSLRVTAPGPAAARVSVGRRQFSIGRPVEFDVDEFRIVRSMSRGMEELSVEIEMRDADLPRLAEALRARIGVRIPVQRVDAGALPRFELKAKRIVDRRKDSAPRGEGFESNASR